MVHFLEQARYSIKSLVPSVADLLSNQALSLLVVAFLGPASLAIFSRSRSLMTTLRTLAVKFGMILVPSASALQARNDLNALRELLLRAPAIISSLVLPVLLAMSVLGDHLIRLWMGEAYIYPGLIAILALGNYATLVQEPVWSLLSGMDTHGRIAIAKLIAACFSALLLAAGLWGFHWGLLGAAVCFALPQVIVDGVIIPVYACSVLGVSKRSYLWRIFVRPLLCSAPFAAALMTGAAVVLDHPLWAMVLFAGGGIVSGLVFLRWLIPTSTKQLLTEAFLRILRKRSVETCV